MWVCLMRINCVESCNKRAWYLPILCYQVIWIIEDEDEGRRRSSTWAMYCQHCISQQRYAIAIDIYQLTIKQSRHRLVLVHSSSLGKEPRANSIAILTCSRVQALNSKSGLKSCVRLTYLDCIFLLVFWGIIRDLIAYIDVLSYRSLLRLSDEKGGRC